MVEETKKTEKNTGFKQRRYILLVVALGALFLTTGCLGLGQTPEGHVGIQQSWGAATGKTIDPGAHWDSIMPGRTYFDYDVRERLYVMSATAGEGQNAARDDSIEIIARDEMIVDMDAAVVWKADRTRVVDLYQNIGGLPQVEDRVRSKARECLRQEGSRYDGLEMTEADARVQIKENALECMQASLGDRGIIVEEVQIRNIRPPQRVINAIEQKEAVEREVEQKRAELQKEELEAERKRIEAQGIRDSQEIIDETLTPQYLQYIWVTEGIEKGDTIYVVPSDGAGQLQMVKDIDSGGNSNEDDDS